jgi:hypothetical protein
MKNFKIQLTLVLFVLSLAVSAQTWTTATSNFNLSNANGAIGTLTNHSLFFRTNNINRFNIHQGGNIGIGTTSAARRVHIHGTGAVVPEKNSTIVPPGSESLLILTNTESGATAWDGLRLGLVQDVAMLATEDKLKLMVKNGPALFSLYPDGRITMGENGSSSPYSAQFGIRSSSANGVLIDNWNNPNGYAMRVQVNQASSEAYSVSLGVSTRFVVKGDGRVGVGTNAPSLDYMLDVAGKARACEVRVNNPGWCDYVFEPSYDLMPLADLKSYINENKHLPEMPSEKEVVEAGGFDLAQMNVALLKRSEENTLYILELEEKINKLAKVVETQTKLIEELTTKSTSNE